MLVHIVKNYMLFFLGKFLACQACKSAYSGISSFSRSIPGTPEIPDEIVFQVNCQPLMFCFYPVVGWLNDGMSSSKIPQVRLQGLMITRLMCEQTTFDMCVQKVLSNKYLVTRQVSVYLP